MLPDARAAWALLALLAVALLALAGCPREAVDPQRPAGTPCATVADCNAGQVCGRLTACVDSRCEGAQSLEIPCPAAR